MEQRTHRTRREFVVYALATPLVGVLAGCSGSSKPARVTDTRVAYDEDRVGVFVSLQDANPDESGPVTVHAELLAGDEVVTEREKEVQHPAQSGSNYVIWFENITDADRERIDGAQASVRA
jgi:hypothetical protein